MFQVLNINFQYIKFKSLSQRIESDFGSNWASLVTRRVKNPSALWHTWVQFLGWEDPLEESMATHSSILAQRISWTDEPGGLQFMRSGGGHNKQLGVHTQSPVVPQLCCGGLVAKLCPTLVTPQAVARQAPLSMGFPRQEFWSGLPCSPPGDLPDLGIKPASSGSPALAGRFFTTKPHTKLNIDQLPMGSKVLQ